MSTDSEFEAKLRTESYELSLRKQKLEDDLRRLETLNTSQQEAAALMEIKAYQIQSLMPRK
jgi:hypothetical protein